MNFSEITLQVFGAMEIGAIKSKADFWDNYNTIEKFSELVKNNPNILKKAEFLKQDFEAKKLTTCVISAFDDNYPTINPKVDFDEMPYIIFYNGNIDLLNNSNTINNIVGLKEPTADILDRQKTVVKNSINSNETIISSLVDGCNMEAIKTCYENNSPAIIVSAFPLNNVYATEEKMKNINLDKKADLTRATVYNNGLIISEYYQNKPVGSPHIQCAKLQVILSNHVTLIASCAEGYDSFSTYSMNFAYDYDVKRYMLYNDSTDKDNKFFSLNKYYLNSDVNII